MQKIMFNDKYGLTQAVLEGQKTMTRRIATTEEIECPNIGWGIKGKERGKRVLCSCNEILAMSRYAKGEVVTIAQRYCDILHCADVPKGDEKGWGNKMFVKADLMPHHIKITNIKVEKLQDISDEDCMKEGIEKYHSVDAHFNRYDAYMVRNGDGLVHEFGTKNPREAFARLIDKVSGKGTWDSNPWVFVYDFKLID